MNDAAKLRSLRGDWAFRRLRKGRSGGGKHLSVRIEPTEHGQVRVGVVVSRKVGNAVTRNRVRRRLREAALALVRERAAGPAGADGSRSRAWPGSFDLLVITRPSAAEASYAALATSLRTAVERALGGGRQAAAAAGVPRDGEPTPAGPAEQAPEGAS